MAYNGPKLNIRIGATGDAAVVGKISKIEAAGAGVDSKYGAATRTMSMFGASMAESGRVGVSALAGLVGVASDIAFSFGPAGAVVGAVAIAVTSITALILKSRREVQKMTDEFKKHIEDLLNAGDYEGLTKEASKIWRGSASKEFKDGLGSLLKEREQLLDKFYAEQNGFEQRKIQQSIIKLNDKIKPLQERFDQVRAAIQMPQMTEFANNLSVTTEAAKKAKKPAEDLATTLGKQASQIAELVKLHAIQGGDIVRLDGLERELVKALDAGNVSREKRLALEQALAKVRATQKDLFGEGPRVSAVDLTAREKAPKVPVQVVPRIPIDEASAQLMLDMEALAPSIAQAAEQTLGQSLVDGFSAAFSGSENPVAAFGKTILRGLGTIFIQVGKTLLGFGKIMSALQKFLTNIFTAGPAAVLAGAALIALGAAFTGITGGSGGGGGMGGIGSGIGSITNPAQITNVTLSNGEAAQRAAQLAPMAPMHFTIIGANDPRVERDIATAVKGAQSRNLL